MKVLNISWGDVAGGASIAAYRQHLALREIGVDSRMLVGFKSSNDPSVTLYERPQAFPRRIARLCRRHILGFGNRYVSRYKATPWRAFARSASETRFTWNEISNGADVVNFHMTSGFVDLATFVPSTPPSVPAIFTLHDMALFTGGCQYAMGCDSFTKTCGNCPALLNPAPDDLSAKEIAIKQRILSERDDLKTAFVADSHWIRSEAHRSFLLRKRDVRVIHYGVDTNLFYPRDKIEAKRSLGLPSSVTTVLFAAENVDDPRKGFSFLVDAIRSLKARNVMLLSVGRQPPHFNSDLAHCHFGYVTNERLMAAIYNSADIFVVSSLYEAFGQTALEAQSCGIPTVAFRSGGLVDIVQHEETGLLTDPLSVSGLASALDRLVEFGEFRAHLSLNARAMVLKRFSMSLNASRYRSLYQELIDR